MDIPKSELCDRYEELYTGVVADALDALGYPDRTLDHDIRPLDRELTTAGIAVPAVGQTNHEVDEEYQMRRFLEMLGDAPEDAVLAIAANDEESSQIGELTTTALAQRGCRGAVVDGGVRDSAFILDQGFPVFRRYHEPADSVPRWELQAWDTTATVGGVEVEPGDVLVGDIDGVVAVPESVAVEVLTEAERKVEDESAVRSAIADGMAPLDAYDEYGVF